MEKFSWGLYSLYTPQIMHMMRRCDADNFDDATVEGVATESGAGGCSEEEEEEGGAVGGAVTRHDCALQSSSRVAGLLVRGRLLRLGGPAPAVSAPLCTPTGLTITTYRTGLDRSNSGL